ncbi:thioredoxin domain-containing protein [Ascobolus immersus RN42]|uniref:Thioredoxin n=1 Tax=Ascobolus immersus RN42 TaxID=1160509 RepID=A0A3N4IRK3_ASCIM|nr:thioredoxin domain-containing protein [Ascobolus immersus RN42]
MVTTITSKAAFDEAIKKDKLVVVDFFATWCGPCRVIAPKVVSFSQEYTDVDFYKVDVDEVPDVASEVQVKAMPTFMFFKNGERVGEVVGANPQVLKQGIEKYK